MTLIVETGDGLETAESYISVADADARHTAFGNTAWASLTEGAKEIALRKAAGYMVQAYRARWAGVRALPTQALDWPRYQVEIDGYWLATGVIPAEVANANADLALKASTDTLAPDLERAIIREKVGPLETEYSPHSSQAKRYPAIDMMLAPYLVSASRLARA